MYVVIFMVYPIVGINFYTFINPFIIRRYGELRCILALIILNAFICYNTYTDKLRRQLKYT